MSSLHWAVRLTQGMALWAVLSNATTAHAWQNDVHFGLTWHVALQAGYSADDARAIAYATEAPDDYDDMDAVSLMIREIILSFDSDDALAASRTIHRLHFASKNRPRNPADKRAVTFPARTPKETARTANTIPELGLALHALEDSWSHSGVPSTPVPWRQDLQWAHPASRDPGALMSALSKRADKTWHWQGHPSDAQNAMREVYDALIANTVLPHTPLPGGFAKVAPGIEACVRALTRVDKQACYPDPDSLDPRRVPYIEQISVAKPTPRSARFSNKAYVEKLPRYPTQVNRGRSVSEGIARASETLLTGWLVRRDLDTAAASFANAVTIASADSKDTNPALSFLRDGLNRDVEEPALTAQSEDDADPLRFETLSQAIRGFSGGTYELRDLRERVERPADYAIAFRYNHKPYAGIVLFAQSNGERLQIVKALEIAD